MISLEHIQYLLGGGGRVVSPDGDKLGNVGNVYVDDHSGQPEWVTVITGIFGGGESLVPLAGATLSGDQITVPHGKDKVKDAPRVNDSEDHLSEGQEVELYQYYGISHFLEQPDSTPPSGDQEPASGSTTGGAMTRSKERRASTDQMTRNTARLRKYIFTDSVAQADPV